MKDDSEKKLKTGGLAIGKNLYVNFNPSNCGTVKEGVGFRFKIDGISQGAFVVDLEELENAIKEVRYRKSLL